MISANVCRFREVPALVRSVFMAPASAPFPLLAALYNRRLSQHKRKVQGRSAGCFFTPHACLVLSKRCCGCLEPEQGLCPTCCWSAQIAALAIQTIYAVQNGYDLWREGLAHDVGIGVAEVLADSPQKLLIRYHRNSFTSLDTACHRRLQTTAKPEVTRHLGVRYLSLLMSVNSGCKYAFAHI